MINKDDFLDWKKNNPITLAVFASIIEKINLGAAELSYSAGVDEKTDRFKCGMIHAYRSILDIDLEEIGGDSEDA